MDGGDSLDYFDVLEIIRLDVQVHPNDQLPIEDTHEDLLLQIVFQIKELSEEAHVVRVGVLGITKDFCHFILHLIGHDLPLTFDVYGYGNDWKRLLSFFCLL